MQQERQENVRHASGGFFQAADPCLSQVDEHAVNAYMVKVFGWMFLGLGVTAATTLVLLMGMGASEAFQYFVFMVIATPAIWVVFIGQFGLVMFLSARALNMNPGLAKFLFLLYAALTGLTVGIISVFISYDVTGGMGLVVTAFGLTAGSFGIMALYGYFTGKDLTGMGSLLRMALFGLIIVMLVNLFLPGNGTLEILICIAGLVIFLGLTAAKTNEIKNHYARVALASTGEYRMAMGSNLDQQGLADNLAIHGALTLYLSFINIFLFILRLLARR